MLQIFDNRLEKQPARDLFGSRHSGPSFEAAKVPISPLASGLDGGFPTSQPTLGHMKTHD